jgi:hypothetical protein
VSTGAKEDDKYWARLGYWILQCYGPFSPGARFETYEPFTSLIFQFFRAALDREYGGTPVYISPLFMYLFIWLFTRTFPYLLVYDRLPSEKQT